MDREEGDHFEDRKVTEVAPAWQQQEEEEQQQQQQQHEEHEVVPIVEAVAVAVLPASTGVPSVTALSQQQPVNMSSSSLLSSSSVPNRSVSSVEEAAEKDYFSSTAAVAATDSTTGTPLQQQQQQNSVSSLGHADDTQNEGDDDGNDNRNQNLALPIAAELAPDHDARLRAMEEELRRKWEARISAVTVAAAADNNLLVEQVHIDDQPPVLVVDNAASTSAATTTDRTSSAAISSGNLPVERVHLDESCAFGILAENNSDTPTNTGGHSSRQHSTSSDRARVPFDIESDNNRHHHSSSRTPRKTACGTNRHKRLGVVAVLLLLVVVAIVVPVVVKIGSDDSTSSSEVDLPGALPPAGQLILPILQTVRERGFLRCKAESLETEKGVGFTIDLCRALAAAIFNDTTKVTLPQINFREHFGALKQGDLDVSASHVSLNMGRDVHEAFSRSGYTYSTPYFYTGTALAGVPNYVDCAEAAETFEQDCRHLQVCVMSNTVTQDIVEAHLPGSATKLVPSHGELFTQFANGTCNVIAGDTVNIYEHRVREAGYQGDYKFANKLLSHEHLAFLLPEDDPEWADFCNWVLQALITAEALDITQDIAHLFVRTNVFGPEYENMFVQAIAAVGNYGELYTRHYGGILPRSQYSKINLGNTGLIVSDPLGTLNVDEENLPEEDLPKPVPGGTMEAVVKRGHLLCGLTTNGSGFAEFSGVQWSGMDVDYCRGLAAAVSAGEEIDIVFVELFDPTTRYASLANKTVDVMVGGNMSLTTDVREPTTGRGFSFATPYFYFGTTATDDTIASGVGGRAIVTRQGNRGDQQWSDLAKWITQATFYAEEKGITQARASEMPVVELFGTTYKQMFRDCINATGNYGEIYSRNMEAHIPRSGRNLLNTEDTPQFYPIPFD